MNNTTSTLFHAPVSQRTILITGATGGIGKAIALGLAGPDVTLALMGRDREKLEEVAIECRGLGARAMALPCDLTETREFGDILSVVQERCGPIQVLINNAGVFLEGTILEADNKAWREWDSALDVNLKSQIHLTRHALPQMREGGAVIFIASIASRKAYAGGSNYCTAKFGILGFAGALFEDIREMGIKVCSILPGHVNTAMHEADESLDPALMIQPGDVAKTVAFILSMPDNVCPTEITLQPQHHTKRRAVHS